MPAPLQGVVGPHKGMTTVGDAMGTHDDELVPRKKAMREIREAGWPMSPSTWTRRGWPVVRVHGREYMRRRVLDVVKRHPNAKFAHAGSPDPVMRSLAAALDYGKRPKVAKNTRRPSHVMGETVQQEIMRIQARERAERIVSERRRQNRLRIVPGEPAEKMDEALRDYRGVIAALTGDQLARATKRWQPTAEQDAAVVAAMRGDALAG